MNDCFDIPAISFYTQQKHVKMKAEKTKRRESRQTQKMGGRKMEKEVRIRRAANQDISRILELLVQVNNVHHEGRPDLFLVDKTKYTEEELAAILLDEQKPVFVAVDGEDRVLGYGFCEFQSHEEDNNWPDIVTLYIDDICVDQACRGCHIGKALYDYILDYARRSGCYHVTLNVWEENRDARAFYEACGLTVQKTCMEKIL